MQQGVAHIFRLAATVGSMDRPAWLMARQSWRRRAKDWKKLKRVRDADMAETLGVARATVNSWLNGREPNLDEALGLIEALGADPGYILFDCPIKQPLTQPAGPNEPKEAISQSEKAKRFKAKRRSLRRTPV